MISDAPTWMHQRAVMELAYRLRYHCPLQWEVLAAPFRVRLDERTDVWPDLVVVRRTAYARDGLHGAPLLAVEVRASGDPADLELRERLAGAGTPSYWVVEAADEPESAAVEVFTRTDDGRYSRVVRVVGEYSYVTTEPFRVSLCPADLVP